MTAIKRNARLALVFGIVGPLLQVIRVALWGSWPPLRQIPVDIDGYVWGALMLWAVVLVRRKHPSGPLALAGGWGFGAGILYRSFFEQLANQDRHAGHEILVMTVKAAMLAGTIYGLVDAARSTRAAEK